jgi:hypothetical protein
VEELRFWFNQYFFMWLLFFILVCTPAFEWLVALCAPQIIQDNLFQFQVVDNDSLTRACSLVVGYSTIVWLYSSLQAIAGTSPRIDNSRNQRPNRKMGCWILIINLIFRSTQIIHLCAHGIVQ